MTAAEARVLMQGEKYKDVDQTKQLADIYAAIESEATEGQSFLRVERIHPLNYQQLIDDKYSLSTNSTSGVTTISWA